MSISSQIDQILTNYLQRPTQISKIHHQNEEFTNNSESQKIDLLEEQNELLIKEVLRLREEVRKNLIYINRLCFGLDNQQFYIQRLQEQIKDLKDLMKSTTEKLKQKVSSLEKLIKEHFQTCKQYFIQNILPLKNQIVQHDYDLTKIAISENLALFRPTKKLDDKQIEDERHFQQEYHRINDFYEGSLQKNTSRQLQNTWTLYLSEKLLQKSKITVKLDSMNYFNWKKLTILSLSYNNIEDEGLKVLTTINMQNLKYLVLQGNQLRDLCNLQNFKKLQSLSLTYAQAQDYSQETTEEHQNLVDNCSYINRLTQKGAIQLTSVFWEQLKWLSVNFICLSETRIRDQYKLSLNQHAWDSFLKNNFVNFPLLNELLVGELKISKKIRQKIVQCTTNSQHKIKTQFSI